MPENGAFAICVEGVAAVKMTDAQLVMCLFDEQQEPDARWTSGKQFEFAMT